MSDTELLPCPFCGGEAERNFVGNNFTKKRSLEIKCTSCRYHRIDKAIHHSHEWLDDVSTKAWNTRHITKADAEAYCKANNMVMVPDKDIRSLLIHSKRLADDVDTDTSVNMDYAIEQIEDMIADQAI